MLDKNTSGSRLKHAVVMGGSMAGLLAARALSNFFEQVTVLERDKEPLPNETRKGAPQGGHAHLLLRRGATLLEEMFPGLLEELRGNGATTGDWGEKVRWFHFGQWKVRYRSKWEVFVMTRPFLEDHIRRRIDAIPNVQFQYGTLVKGFAINAESNTVNGVRIQRNKEEEEVLESDLLVDATGRGSQTSVWLEKLGFGQTPQTRVGIGLGYSSRLYEAPEGTSSDWVSMMVYPTPPIQTDAGYIMKVEGNRWMVTMAGYLGHHPRTRDPHFLEFSQRLGANDIYEELKKAKPLTEVKTYRYPEEVRNHYEKLAGFPNGLVVVGDATCSFDPVFGQGMTAAALEAQALEKTLEASRKGGRLVLKNFPKRFHKRLARIINTPWLLATSEAFRWPLTEGVRPLTTRLLQWYTGRVFVVSHKSAATYDALLNVLHMMSGPLSLFKPGIFFRVLLSAAGSFLRSWQTSPMESRVDPVQD